MLSSSCSTKESIKIVIPPTNLLTNYEVPNFKRTTNINLIEYIIDLQELIEIHNTDKQSIVDFYSKLKE